MTTLIGDGIADDTDAVIDCINSGQVLPAGTFRITHKLSFIANEAISTGPVIVGTHRLKTIILADYNETDTRAGIIELIPDVISHYSYGAKIRDLSIKAAPGRTGHNGIALTAAWFVDIDNVQIEGLSGHGIHTPLRLDLHPTISDYYQGFSVTVRRCLIKDNGGNGIEFAAGQSPGLYVAQHNYITGNNINIRSTTGQCIINQNTMYYGKTGGLFFDTVEGPSMVAEVTQNEIQNNKLWGVNIQRSRGLYFCRNRLLSQTAGTFNQAVNVNFGTSAYPSEVWNLIAEQNLFRSDITSGAYGFIAGVNAFTSAQPSYFRGNIFTTPAGFGKFVGPFTGATIQN